MFSTSSSQTTEEQAALSIDQSSEKQILIHINELSRANDLEQIIGLLEVPNFPTSLIHQILMTDLSDDLSLMNKAIFLMEDSPELIQRLWAICSPSLLAEVLLHDFKQYGSPFLRLIKIIHGSKQISALTIQHALSYISTFIEICDAKAVDKFIIQNNSDNDCNLISLMQYGSNENFLKILKKADPAIIRIAILKCIRESTDLFSFSLKFLSPSAYQFLILERDAETVQYIQKALPFTNKSYLEKSAIKYTSMPIEQPAINDEGVKTTEELLTEIEELNVDNPFFEELCSNGELRIRLNRIKQNYKSVLKLGVSPKPISEWDRSEISLWANAIKQRKDKIETLELQLEAIAVCIQATKIEFDYLPRDPQLLAIILFLDEKKMGLLAQVEMSEGKSLIIAILASIKVLFGKKVDVVTSQAILAVAASEEFKPFYNLFNISVADNWDLKDGGIYRGGVKECYNADIVYGDVTSFQYDILRHEYYGENTRNNRPFDIVIGDEIDNLLVDEFSRGGRLMTAKSSMEHLLILQFAVWQELARVIHELKKEKTVSDYDIPLIKSILHEHLIYLISNPSSEVFIPNHLKEFAEYQINHWEESAIEARFNYSENMDYVINKDQEGNKIISPVDYSNTGMVQTSTVWDNGVHQFLQIKHGVRIEPERLFACSMSNLAFFKRYGANIYGLSGTLGDQATHKLLREVYTVDLVNIPTYKNSKFIESPGLLCNNSKEWLDAIVNSVSTQINDGRAALIICKSIHDVNQIESALNLKLNPEHTSIKRYARSDNNEKLIINEKVNKGNVIIATNLAGRGAHLRVSEEVESKGGLFVAVTFLPDSKRTEDQAFRRTARGGNLGSAQLIIDKSKSRFPYANDINDIKKLRDDDEIEKLDHIRNFESLKIKLEDDLFSDFSLFTLKLRGDDSDPLMISEMEDRWGFWLKKCIDQITKTGVIARTKIVLDHHDFLEQLENEYSQSEYTNPYHIIQKANKAIDAKTAIQHHTTAISLDSKLSVQAYVNRALRRIKDKVGNYQEDALNDFAIAKLILEENHMSTQQGIHIINNDCPEALIGQTELNKQIQTKIALYKSEIQHIDRAMHVIRNADSSSTLDVKMNGGLYRAFDELHASHSEMTELLGSGLQDFFDVEEIHEEEDDDDIFGIFAVIGLGIMQIAVGVAISIAPGLGPLIGAALISEGIGDIIFAVRGAMEGNFSLDQYISGKATSIAISVITAGIDIMKIKFAEQAGKEATLQAAKQSLTRDQLLKQARREIPYAVTIAVTKELSSIALSGFSRNVLNGFKDEIRDHVGKKLQHRLNQAKIVSSVDKLLAASQHTPQYLHEKMQRLALSILAANTRSRSAAETIFKGVIARRHSFLSNLIKVGEMGTALDDILNLTESFCDDFAISITALSHSLAPSSGDQSQPRNQLYDSLINLITNNIMSAINGQILRPAADSVINVTFSHFLEETQKVSHDFQFSADENLLYPDAIVDNRALENKHYNAEEKTVINKSYPSKFKHTLSPLSILDNNSETNKLTWALLETQKTKSNYYNFVFQELHHSKITNSKQQYSISDQSSKDYKKAYGILNKKFKEHVPSFLSLGMNGVKYFGYIDIIGEIAQNTEAWLQLDKSITDESRRIVSTYPNTIDLPFNSLDDFPTAWADMHQAKGMFTVLKAGSRALAKTKGIFKDIINNELSQSLAAALMDSRSYQYDISHTRFIFPPASNETNTNNSSIADALSCIGNKFYQWHVPERALGLAQCVGGVAQVGVSVVGGVLTAQTCVGPIIATGYATMGIDAATAGCQAAWTGHYQPTLFNKGLQGFGLNETQAALAEISINIGPVITLPVMKVMNSALSEIGLFRSKIKTYVGLRNGNIFASRPTLYHAKTNLEATQNIVNGIPTSLNPNNRFGAAFYTAQNGYTTINELAHHGARARYAIRYQLNESQISVLDLTQPSIARQWNYRGGNDYNVSQAIADKARKAGYNVIRFTSERGRGRGAGANLAILEDFNTILSPQKIVTVPIKQPPRFSNPWRK